MSDLRSVIEQQIIDQIGPRPQMSPRPDHYIYLHKDTTHHKLSQSKELQTKCEAKILQTQGQTHKHKKRKTLNQKCFATNKIFKNFPKLPQPITLDLGLVDDLETTCEDSDTLQIVIIFFMVRGLPKYIQQIDKTEIQKLSEPLISFGTAENHNPKNN